MHYADYACTKRTKRTKHMVLHQWVSDYVPCRTLRTCRARLRTCLRIVLFVLFRLFVSSVSTLCARCPLRFASDSDSVFLHFPSFLPSFRPFSFSSQALDLTYYVRAAVCGISVSSSAGNAQRRLRGADAVRCRGMPRKGPPKRSSRKQSSSFHFRQNL